MVTTTTRVPREVILPITPIKSEEAGERIKIWAKNTYLSPQHEVGPLWLSKETAWKAGELTMVHLARRNQKKLCPTNPDGNPDMTQARPWHFWCDVIEWDTNRDEGYIPDPEPKPVTETPSNPPSNEGADLMGAIDEQENKGADYASKDSDTFVATSMDSSNNGDTKYDKPGEYTQDSDTFRTKEELRFTEAVHIAIVAAAEVDINWTKIEANSHRIYAMLKRGPQADILAQIEQDTQ